MWLVKIVKMPTINDYRSNFFPRKVYYKKDALELKKEVETKGGQAYIERTK